MATRLYLHRDTSGLPSGTLPSAEQSTLTSANDFEANQTTNRLMNTTAPSGLSDNMTNASTASTSEVIYYVARWVSPAIFQTSVSANTWTYQFRTGESNAQANFPCTGANQPVYVNCYVWKPSNGTKYGTILDGNTASTASEGNPITNTVTFSGSAVSSLTSGDAIIVFEAWFRITQGMATSYTQEWFYDGNSAGVTDSFIETPETISFTASQNFDRNLEDSVSVSDQLTRTYGANRTLSESSISVNDVVEIVQTVTRTLSEAAVSVVDDLVRAVTNVRELIEGTDIVDDVQRIIGFPRNLEDTTNVSDDVDRDVTNIRELPETTSVSDDVQRQLGASREITESSIAVTDDLTKSQGISRAITESAISVLDDLARLIGFNRNIPESVISSDDVDRDVTNVRSLPESTSVNDQVDRTYGADRSLPESTSVSDDVTRSVTITRVLTEASIAIGDLLERLYGAVRNLGDTIGITDDLETIHTPGGGGSQNFDRELDDTVNVGDQLDRTLGANRNLEDSTDVSDDVQRSVTITRVLTEAGIVVNDQLVRIYNGVKELSDNVGVTDQLQTSVGFVRNLSDTIGITDLVERTTTIIRNLVDSISVSDILSVFKQGQMHVSTTDPTIIITKWLEDNWTDDPVSTVEHYLIPPKSKITFGSRFDMAAGTHSDMHVHVRNTSQSPDFINTAATIEENSDIITIIVEVRYIPDTPPDFSGDNAGAPSDMMWQIRSYIDELIRSNPEQLEQYGIEVVSLLQEIPDANTPADVHAQNVNENMYTIVFLMKCFYTLEIDRVS